MRSRRTHLLRDQLGGAGAGSWQIADGGATPDQYFTALNRGGGPCGRKLKVVLTPVSDIKALAHLLRQGELLRLREPQKWILRPIRGLGGYS